MKKETIFNKLIKQGYHVTHVISTGSYIATKGQRSYAADSLNELYRIIFN
jgi:hypothetical protein